MKQHQSKPPYPERIIMSKPSPQAEFDVLGESHNLFFKISLLLSMKDVQYTQRLLENIVQRNL